ncbi:hypothetical protein BD413DRAFT_98761 [Trametes elegans]|nr:hypothetical protein BD413DRAFT_98761 [Trametes elegans]
MFWLQLFRLIVLVWATFCAIVLLGLGGHTLSAVGDLRLPTFAWAGLAVATAVLAFISLPIMVVVDFLRTGAFTSLIVVELAWLSFIGVLFLATGASASENAADYWVNCQSWTPAFARNLCSEVSAAAAFGFLGWLPLWAYTITLLVVLIIYASRGQYIWRSFVKDAAFKTVAPDTAAAPGVPAYGTEAKPYEAAALNPGQVPYAYPPPTTNSPPQTAYGVPAGAPPAQSPYPQV